MPTSFYNLPPPWHPGYADPGNVEAEGLVRGTFTTRQLPRGTYDEPAVGTGGYAVPEYVMDEGYGQGAFVTKWMPRGETVIPDPRYLETPTTIVGPASPVRGGVSYPMAVLNGLGSDLPPVSALPEPGGAADPIRQYGVKAARAITSRLRKLPINERPIAMRAVLDTIDRGLWNRVQTRAQPLVKRGQSAPAALEQALASSFSDGMLQEIIKTGKKKTAPGTTSLMGLGCYGCGMALGAVAESVASSTSVASGTPAQATTEQEYLAVGPFTFGVGLPEQRVTYRTASLPADWKTWFAKEGARLTKMAYAQTEEKLRGTSGPGGTMKAGTTGNKPTTAALKSGAVFKFRKFGNQRVVEAKSMGLDKWFGMDPKTPVFEMFFNNSTPVIRTKHPKSGKDYGVYLTATPTSFTVKFREAPPEHRNLLEKIWDGIAYIGAVIKKVAVAAYEAAKEAVADLGDLACDLLNTAGADVAAAAGAAAAGAPPQAGATGAQVGRQICNSTPKQDVPVAPPPPPAGVGLGLVAAGLAAAGGLAWYFTR